MGFWCSWLPWALPQRWPSCWWIAVAVDHCSRRVMGFALFEQQPTSAAVRASLGRTLRKARSCPRHLITDHGRQFTDDSFRRRCRRRGIRQRFGAVEKFGSLSVVEWYNGHRPHRTLKARTPDEVYFDLPPDCRAARLEPRRRWPRGCPCAGAQAPVRGRCGQRLDLNVTYLVGRRHLPIVELKRAA
jgi:hypothetical protein